jgi:hypothetical protein
MGALISSIVPPKKCDSLEEICYRLIGRAMNPVRMDGVFVVFKQQDLDSTARPSVDRANGSGGSPCVDGGIAICHRQARSAVAGGDEPATILHRIIRSIAIHRCDWPDEAGWRRGRLASWIFGPRTPSLVGRHSFCPRVASKSRDNLDPQTRDRLYARLISKQGLGTRDLDRFRSRNQA